MRRKPVLLPDLCSVLFYVLIKEERAVQTETCVLAETSLLTGTSLLSTKIPSRIGRLEELAYNFWWSWHREARDLFKMLDYSLWRSTGHNPARMLLEMSPGQLEERACDPLFLRQYDAVMMALDQDLCNGHLWFPEKYPELTDRPIAYFSAEFGLHQSLPIYSGGLGVLLAIIARNPAILGSHLSQWASSTKWVTSASISPPMGGRKRSIHASTPKKSLFAEPWMKVERLFVFRLRSAIASSTSRSGMSGLGV